MNPIKVLVGVMAGITVGTAIGVLFAPAKGSRTRKKIAKIKQHYTDDVKGKFDEFIERISDKFDDIKEHVSASMQQNKLKTQEKT